MVTASNIFVVFLLLHHSFISGERNLFIYCGACLCMVEEFGWHMAATSEKLKVQTGSFRLDPKGNQDTHQIPFKKSEIQMIELTEGICGTMYDYHVYTDTQTGRKSFIRTTGRTGENVSLKNIMISEYITKDLQFACETLMEEFEDDLISLFQNDQKEIEEKLCVNVAGVCTSQEVKERRMHTASAIMDGLNLNLSGKGGFNFKTPVEEEEDDEEDDEEYCDEGDEDCEDYCEEGDEDCEENDEDTDSNDADTNDGEVDSNNDDLCDEDDDNCEVEYEPCDEDDEDCELEEERIFDDDDENHDLRFRIFQKFRK